MLNRSNPLKLWEVCLILVYDKWKNASFIEKLLKHFWHLTIKVGSCAP